MLKFSSIPTKHLISTISFIVFSLLDLLDSILCIFYRFIDELLEGNSHQCYCEKRGEQSMQGGCEVENGLSETLYGRKNLFRSLGHLGLRRMRDNCGKIVKAQKKPRWSDCNCDSCISWQKNGEDKLHFVVFEPTLANGEGGGRDSIENVIFIHGFLSSSSYWTDTVFPNLSEYARLNYRLFALDLLGFGRSPKPQDCLYRLEDHLGAIERSVIEPFQMNSFHLVAHSMGCIIALALAAKYPRSVKSITLVAPPYFPSTKANASNTALNRLAERTLWPPLQFASSVMSWYEHIGRSVCFLFCRNHRMWEWILKKVTTRRNLHFLIVNLTRHTHHSAWHTMHNVICGGAKLLDDCLEVVNKSMIEVTIIQGDRDQVVPLECSYNVKQKVPHAKVQIISSANHTTVVLSREKDFTRDLELVWSSSKVYQ